MLFSFNEVSVSSKELFSSRGKGQSAIASAAYRSGERLYSERYDKLSSYHHRDVLPEKMLLKPVHAPEWYLNRERLWNEVEKIEKAKNVQLAREFTVALPVELSKQQQGELLRHFVQEVFVDEGMLADIAIHRDDNKNPHAHVMLTMRPFWGPVRKMRIYNVKEKRTQNKSILNANCWAALVLNSDKV